MSIFNIIQEVNFETQSLKIQQEYPKKYEHLINCYVHIPNEEFPPAKLIYKDEKHKEIFSCFEKLGIFLQKNKISLLQLAECKTNELSEFLSRFLKLGRVVKNHLLYEFLKQDYQIDNLDEASPKLRGKHLQFLTYSPKPSNNFEPPIIEVECSIVNFNHQTKERYYRYNNR